jgi:hypothetical protein
LQILDEIPKTASEKPQDRFLIEALQSEAAEVYAFRNRQVRRVVSSAFDAASAAEKRTTLEPAQQ